MAGAQMISPSRDASQVLADRVAVVGGLVDRGERVGVQQQ